MVSLCCPFCDKPERVVKHRTNRGGTARPRCLAYRKTFTPQPNPRQVTAGKEHQILDALAERISQRGIARMLKDAWNDVPQDWRSQAVFTDHCIHARMTYARFFPAHQHTACDKGSGLTSHAEAWNTKWRQCHRRQSGLVRKSCGVHPRIADDLYDRFLILVTQHNQQRKKRWERRRLQTTH